MKTNPLKWAALAFAAVCSATTTTAAPAGDNPNLLWYDKPAVKWVEALPVGNGRLGAMVFGGASQERLQLNEGTLWAGGPYDPVNPEAKEALPQVRQLINEAKYREAARLISAKVMAKPLGQMPYQTVGDLLLTFPGATNVENYRRELNLDTATATVSYTSDGVRYTREVFASAPDNVIVVRLTADKPGKISFTAGMKTPMKAHGGNGRQRHAGHARNGRRLRRHQGPAQVSGPRQSHRQGRQDRPPKPARVSVTNANEVTLLITAATSYKKFDDVSGDPESIVKQQLAAAARKTFAKLRAAHLADYQALFRRVTIGPRPERCDEAADGRAHPAFRRRQRPATGGALLPVWALSAHQLLASGRPAGRPCRASGTKA